MLNANDRFNRGVKTSGTVDLTTITASGITWSATVGPVAEETEAAFTAAFSRARKVKLSRQLELRGSKVKRSADATGDAAKEDLEEYYGLTVASGHRQAKSPANGSPVAN